MQQQNTLNLNDIPLQHQSLTKKPMTGVRSIKCAWFGTSLMIDHLELEYNRKIMWVITKWVNSEECNKWDMVISSIKQLQCQISRIKP